MSLRNVLKSLLFIALLVSFTIPNLYASELEQKIKAVENGLLPPSYQKDQPIPYKTLNDRMEELKIPGVSIAVINDGKVEWAKGYGILQMGKDNPVDSETLFQAASISKPVAAMAALYFVQNGTIDLDSDVNNYLKSWRVPENKFTENEKVTLRRLLSHTAGLTVHGFDGYAHDEDVPTTIQVLNGEKPANSDPIRADIVPGSKWRYSGGGYTVMQLLLEDVSGQPFPVLLSETVLTKAGMSRSGYLQPLPQSMQANAAPGHWRNGAPIPGQWHTYPELAAAGLWTTPTDLARFAIEIQNAFHGCSDKILNQDTATEMLTAQDNYYGLGLGLYGKDDLAVFRHGGANAGFRCHLYAFQNRGQGAVIMTNSYRGDELFDEIYRSISRVYDWPTYKPEVIGSPRTIVFHVTAPNLPEKDKIYITGNHPKLGDWNPSVIALQKNNDGTWSRIIAIEEGKHLEYKITRGSWDKEAVAKDGQVPPNSILQVKEDTIVEIQVTSWKDQVSK